MVKCPAKVVGQFVESADLAGLKKVVHADFDWKKFGATLLRIALLKAAQTAETGQTQRYQEIVEWMISKGADPTEKSADKSAFELAFFLHQDQGYETKCFRQMLLILSGATAKQRETVEIDRAVLQRWESIRNKADTHNVTFETAEGPVTAHDVVLMVTSPVLTAMLESTMSEGTSKCIRVPDSSAAAVALFLDMVYMSATDSDLECKTVLGALDLSHRWEVHSVVRVFEDVLEDMLTSSNFLEVAEAAALKDLKGLKRACAKLAETDDNVKALVPSLAGVKSFGLCLKMK